MLQCPLHHHHHHQHSLLLLTVSVGQYTVVNIICPCLRIELRNLNQDRSCHGLRGLLITLRQRSESFTTRYNRIYRGTKMLVLQCIQHPFTTSSHWNYMKSQQLQGLASFRLGSGLLGAWCRTFVPRTIR